MTLILYESPKRLEKTLKDMAENWGDRKAAVARELTKVHEEVFRGRISEALSHFAGEVRGEIVLVVEGAGQGADARPESGVAGNIASWREELHALMAGGLSSKEAVQTVADRCGLPRRMVYQAALEVKRQK